MTKLKSRRNLRPKVVENPAATGNLLPLRPVITKKKARTKLHRRHRWRISPILFSPSNTATPPPFFTPILSADDISCCPTGRVVVLALAAGDHDRDGELISLESRKRKSMGIELEARPRSSPIIRRYYSKRRLGAKSMAGNGVNDQVSELSRVATNSYSVDAGSIARAREMKNGAGDSNSVMETNVQKLSSNTGELRRVRSEVKQSEDEIRGTPEVHESWCMTHKSRSESPKQEADEISVEESAFVDQMPKSLAGMEGELACLEQFPREEVDSMLLDSGSQFSQKADSADSCSSPTHPGLVLAVVGDSDLPGKSSIGSSPLLFSSFKFSFLLLSSIFLASSVLVFDLLVTFYS